MVPPPCARLEEDKSVSAPFFLKVLFNLTYLIHFLPYFEIISNLHNNFQNSTKNLNILHPHSLLLTFYHISFIIPSPYLGMSANIKRSSLSLLPSDFFLRLLGEIPVLNVVKFPDKSSRSTDSRRCWNAWRETYSTAITAVIHRDAGQLPLPGVFCLCHLLPRDNWGHNLVAGNNCCYYDSVG